MATIPRRKAIDYRWRHKRELKRRTKVYLACKGKCIWCGRHINYQNFSLEHYTIPTCVLGHQINEMWNLRIACVSCNTRRGGLYYESMTHHLVNKLCRPHLNNCILISNTLGEQAYEDFYSEWAFLEMIQFDVVGYLLRNFV